MSAQQTDASTSNANWGTLVIVLWVVIGAVVLGLLIKNGELDKNTSRITITAPAQSAPTVDTPPTPTAAPTVNIAPTTAPAAPKAAPGAPEAVR